MVMTIDGRDENKNLTMLHSKNRTKVVCRTGQRYGHSNCNLNFNIIFL